MEPKILRLVWFHFRFYIVVSKESFTLGGGYVKWAQ